MVSKKDLRNFATISITGEPQHGTLYSRLPLFHSSFNMTSKKTSPEENERHVVISKYAYDSPLLQALWK